VFDAAEVHGEINPVNNNKDLLWLKSGDRSDFHTPPVLRERIARETPALVVLSNFYCQVVQRIVEFEELRDSFAPPPALSFSAIASPGATRAKFPPARHKTPAFGYPTSPASSNEPRLKPRTHTPLGAAPAIACRLAAGSTPPSK
jgi:hypothetical protein